MLVVKQHGGETGTGEACAAITREVDHPNIKVNYDAGNVLDYLDKDPIPDIKLCADGGAELLHQGSPQLAEGRGLRPRLRRDRPLQAAAPRRVHGADDAAGLREHLRPAGAAARRSRKAWTRWRSGPASSWRL